MIARLAATRFLAVLGSSGTGKSSLVNTGLLTGLEMGLLPGGGSDWRIVDFQPGTSPMRNLADRLLSSAGDRGVKGSAADASRLRDRLMRGGPRALIEWCREGGLEDGTNLLLLVDQFEELFRYQSDAGREQAEAFVALLLESHCPIEVDDARDAPLPIFVTITMRSEYLGACALIGGLAEVINKGTFLTPRMTRKQCEEAIVGPARVCGVEIEDRLVARVLNDLANFASFEDREAQSQHVDQLTRLARRADQLPLMQHALNRMWYRARATKPSGENIKLLTAEYKGLERELDEHADSIVKELGEEKLPVVENVFRALTEGTTVFDAGRRPARYGELVAICAGRRADVAAVVAAFAGPGVHFLTGVPQTGPPPSDEARIDISHESLIRQWKKLSIWLEHEARDAYDWKKLIDSARDDEVLSGRKLDNAVALLTEIQKKPAWAERYGNRFEEVNRFVDASLKAAEASRAAARARRLKTVWLRTGAITAVFVVLSVGAYLYQYLEARSAREELTQLQMQQQAAIAAQNFQLVVTSAQHLLDQIDESLNYGSILHKGAKDLLQITEVIVNQVHDRAKTLETIRLMTSLLLTRSDISYTLGEYEQAHNIAKSAKDLIEPLLRDNNPQVAILAYNISWRMADALADDPSADAEMLGQGLQEFRYAENLARALAAIDPGDEAHERKIMFALEKIGDIHQRQSDWEGAIAEYRTCLEIMQRLVGKNADNRDWKRDLANVHSRLGQALDNKKDFDGAMEQFTAALDIRNNLLRTNPNDNIIRTNVAASHEELGRLYEHRNELTKALQEYRSAQAIREPLADKDPTNAAWAKQLAPVYMYIGAILKKTDDLAGALQEYVRALRIREDLANRDPTNFDLQDILASTRYAVADLQESQKQLDEALQNYRYAVEALDDLAHNSPKKAMSYRHRAFAGRVKMGDIFALKMNHDAALDEYRAALTIAQQLAAQDQNDIKSQRNLVLVYIKIGNELITLEDSSSALEQYDAALGLVKRLLGDNPNNADWIDLLQSLQTKIQTLRVKL
jgi:tetratricopeptide (TPR) repeat protein